MDLNDANFAKSIPSGFLENRNSAADYFTASLGWFAGSAILLSIPAGFIADPDIARYLGTLGVTSMLVAIKAEIIRRWNSE